MSESADALADTSLKSADSLRPLLVKLAAGLCAFTIAVYQSWFMPFFFPFFTGRDGPARLVIYAIYGAVLIISIAVLATRRDVRSKILPLAIAATMAVAAMALHPVGIVAKSYLLTVFVGGAAIVLMLASAPSTVLRLSASVTALNAVICLLDLFFADGFTNTLGRAAGLAINPNVAAAGLLLGGAASYRAVSKKWRASFLVLVGAALLVTISRSTLLAAFAAVAVPVAAHIWQRYRHGQRFRIDPAGWTHAFVVALVLLGAVGTALMTNTYFRTAIGESFAGILSAGKALDSAAEAVNTSLDQASTISASTPVVASPMQALGERLTDEGKRNSISARALFLKRGLLAYREGGFFGRGLEEAQALAPHNTFVLFAIAFGHLGWLIPLGLAGFAFCFVRDARDLPLGIAVVGLMLTSHDILLTPSLFLPIALGIGGMLAGRPVLEGNEATRWSFACGGVGGAALFVIGCIAILILTPRLVVERLSAETMQAARGAYKVLLPPPQFPGLFHFTVLPAALPSEAPYLREDTASLQHVGWSPQARPAVQRGQYTFRRSDTLLFAASDASDPRQNGRSYEVGVPLSINPLCYILLSMIAAWSLATLASIRRSHRPDSP